MKWDKLTKETFEKITKMKEDSRTDKEIAKFLNIGMTTFYEWKKTKPDFSNALAIGEKEITEKIKNRLIDMCLGFEYKDLIKNVKTIKDKNGKILTQEITEKINIKYNLPSINGIMYYLNNKASDEFVDKKDIIIGGEDDGKCGNLEENINTYLEEIQEMDNKIKK